MIDIHVPYAVPFTMSVFGWVLDMNDEQCPKCGAVFPASRAWANRTVTMLILAPALQDLDTRVQCPSCGNVFQATAFRFFGFVSPRALRIAIGFFMATILVAAIYLVFIASP
ncbi:MAG: hypothetical protein EPO06_08135 [Burkholderiaceae bacterium]|nr:MAG: hypothetical protein EPO06_08135 [Burkholderiaceae bacterium]